MFDSLKSGLFILARDLRLSGLFEFLDGSQQPLSNCLSHLLVCGGTVKSLQRRTQFIERNVPARDGFATTFLWDEFQQRTVWTRIGRASTLEAGGGIFKD